MFRCHHRVINDDVGAAGSSAVAGAVEMDYTAHTKTKRTRDQTLTSALHQVGSTNEHARHTLLASRSRWADVNLAASGRRGNVRDMPGSRDAWRNSYGTRSNGRDTGRDNVQRCNRGRDRDRRRCGDNRGWRTKSGTESRGEGVRSVPFPIGNVYSRIGHRASPVFSSVANKNFPSLGNGPSYLKTGRSANEVGHKPNVEFQPLPRSIGRCTRASD